MKSTDERGKLALQRSRIYAFLAAAYNELPRTVWVKRLSGLSTIEFQEISESNNENIRLGLELLAGFAVSFDSHQAEEWELILGREWTKLFRGVKPGYGPPPPYAGLYHECGQEDLMETYRAAGLNPDSRIQERPDYVGIELEFLRTLSEQEAQCWEQGLRAKAYTLMEQEYAFLTGHLLHWFPQFGVNSLAQAEVGFYKGVIHITQGFLEVDQDLLSGFLA